MVRVAPFFLTHGVVVVVSGKVGNGPVIKWLNFGADPDHGSVSRQW